MLCSRYEDGTDLFLAGYLFLAREGEFLAFGEPRLSPFLFFS